MCLALEAGAEVAQVVADDAEGEIEQGGDLVLAPALELEVVDLGLAFVAGEHGTFGRTCVRTVSID